MTHVSNKLGESFLYHIWDGGHLRTDFLKTTQQQKIEVLFPGRWNMDSGPDFVGALLKIDGNITKGDIEIHLNPNDWYLHHHHTDERYDDVILHAVLTGNADVKSCVTKSGRQIPTLILSDFFDESVSRLRTKPKWLLDTPPKKWPDVCLLSSKSSMKLESVLDHWGLQRLHLKKDRFKEERDYFQFNDLIYQGLCEALGYSKNREPFFKLSLMLPLKLVWDEISGMEESEALLKLQALFWGTSGILNDAEQKHSSVSLDVSQFIQRLKFYWYPFKENYQQPQMKFKEWQFFRLRPVNFPTVRMAALCKLLVLRRKTGFLEPVLTVFRDLERKTDRIFHQLQQQFIVENYGLWRNHYRFDDSDSSQKKYRLIGLNKAREIVINVILPIVYAYAEETEDSTLQDLVKIVYFRSPSMQSNQLLRRMRQQLNLSNSPSQIDINNACRQQGMIYLAKMLCPKWHCQDCISSVQ